MSYTIITVTAQYMSPASVPAAGTVTFQLTSPLQQPSGVIVDEEPIAETLDNDGNLSVNLVATNDPTTTPFDAAYKVTEEMVGAPANVYYIIVPYNAEGLTIPLGACTQVLPSEPPTQNFVTYEGLQAAILAAEGSFGGGGGGSISAQLALDYGVAFVADYLSEEYCANYTANGTTYLDCAGAYGMALNSLPFRAITVAQNPVPNVSNRAGIVVFPNGVLWAGFYGAAGVNYPTNPSGYPVGGYGSHTLNGVGTTIIFKNNGPLCKVMGAGRGTTRIMCTGVNTEQPVAYAYTTAVGYEDAPNINGSGFTAAYTPHNGGWCDLTLDGMYAAAGSVGWYTQGGEGMFSNIEVQYLGPQAAPLLEAVVASGGHMEAGYYGFVITANGFVGVNEYLLGFDGPRSYEQQIYVGGSNNAITVTFPPFLTEPGPPNGWNVYGCYYGASTSAKDGPFILSEGPVTGASCTLTLTPTGTETTPPPYRWNPANGSARPCIAQAGAQTASNCASVGILVSNSGGWWERALFQNVKLVGNANGIYFVGNGVGVPEVSSMNALMAQFDMTIPPGCNGLVVDNYANLYHPRDIVIGTVAYQANDGKNGYAVLCYGGGGIRDGRFSMFPEAQPNEGWQTGYATDVGAGKYNPYGAFLITDVGGTPTYTPQYQPPTDVGIDTVHNSYLTGCSGTIELTGGGLAWVGISDVTGSGLPTKQQVSCAETVGYTGVITGDSTWVGYMGGPPSGEGYPSTFPYFVTYQQFLAPGDVA